MGRMNFTQSNLDKVTCPEGKSQEIAWDSKVGGLGLRVTPKGSKTFVFQSRLGKGTFRIAIGRRDAWSIDAARERAREFQRDIDRGVDPRSKLKAQIIASVRMAERNRPLMSWWDKYLSTRRAHWSENHYRDHLVSSRKISDASNGKEGCLVFLLNQNPRDITPELMRDWASENLRTRPSATRLSYRHFRSFINWILEEDEEFEMNARAIDNKRLREMLGTSKARSDCLQKEQLQSWFAQINQISNKTIANYLKVLLLTGARREEISHLRWSDVDFKWKTMTIKDKSSKDVRVIPLTRYVESLLFEQERFNEYVFYSPRSKSGRLINAFKRHSQATNEIGVKLTLHGLRRSYKTLSEWLEIPLGIVSQIQGHKPSATVEKHYTVRPIDLLRKHHQTLEDWILTQAGIDHD